MTAKVLRFRSREDLEAERRLAETRKAARKRAVRANPALREDRQDLPSDVEPSE